MSTNPFRTDARGWKPVAKLRIATQTTHRGRKLPQHGPTRMGDAARRAARSLRSFILSAIGMRRPAARWARGHRHYSRHRAAAAGPCHHSRYGNHLPWSGPQHSLDLQSAVREDPVGRGGFELAHLCCPHADYPEVEIWDRS